TVNAARELIRLRRDNHDDFEFISNNYHERIWKIIFNQLFLNRGFTASPSQYQRKCTDIDLVLVRIIDPILMVVLRIIDPILTIVIYRIVDHVPAIIQEIIDPVSEDTEGGHILHE
ncbi:15926_t:CDS:2, partial [Funneliformis geosporum]